MSLIEIHNVCFYKIVFKTVEMEKVIREMQLIRGHLRTEISFLDWIHTSIKFIEDNIRTIKQEEV